MKLHHSMPTLAQKLSMTAPISPLRRKARRLGVDSVERMIAAAVARGCRHYALTVRVFESPPALSDLSNEELTILLLSGENPYEPYAIRCAAQLARSADVDPARLAFMAVREKTERVLAHIARSGIAHDCEGRSFWTSVLSHLHRTETREEPELPHWSRFVSMPGLQRGGMAPTTWLTPET